MSPSRRALANYAAKQLIASTAPAKLARQLAAALIASGKTKEADLLLADIAEALEARGLLARATVTSAHQLSADLKKKLSEYVKTSTGVKSVSMSHVIDPGVIGGFRVETAGRTLDKTIAHQLSEIKGGINA